MQSTESASTPISGGGWRYNPDDPTDAADFADHTLEELWAAEADGVDMSDHPAWRPMDADTLRSYVDQLTLPAHVHAEVLSGRDAATGAQLVYAVVWGDRTYSTCPRCGQPVAVTPQCPLGLDTGWVGGRMQPRDQQHGCGAWLPVIATHLDSPTIAEVAQAAADAAQEWAGDLQAERRHIRRTLAKDLRDALATPRDDDETQHEWAERVTTGNDMHPGVYHDSGQWIAWAFEPLTTDGEPITVTETDLQGE